MKKINIIGSILILLYSATYAQITKGTILMGGGFSFSRNTNSSNSVNSNENKTTQGEISPDFGYFISDKLVLGISPSYQFYKTSSKLSPTQSNSSDRQTFFFGPFIRFYQNIGDRVSIFGETGIEFGFGKTDFENIFGNTPTTITTNDFNVNLSISPGIVFFATRRLGLEARFGNLGYHYSKSQADDSETERSNFGINFNISSLSLGIQYYLGKQF